MPLPILEKTYQFNVNSWTDPLASTTEDKDRAAMLWLKNTLIGWTLSPWVVNYSCDGVTPGTLGDNDDRWSDTTDLVWASSGTAHSWMVLDAPVGSCQICINLGSGVTRVAQFIFSSEGLFTGGTVLNRPTADDETVTASEEWLDSSWVDPYQVVTHMLQSTDGKLCVFIVCRSDQPVGGWIFFEADDPEEGWSAPYGFWRIDAHTSGRWYYAQFLEELGVYTGAKVAYTGDAGQLFEFQFCAEGIEAPGGAVSKVPVGEALPGRNKISHEFSMTPALVVSTTTGALGVKGRIPDLYFAGTALDNGALLEDDEHNPEFKWAVFGNVVVPWNGTVPVRG